MMAGLDAALHVASMGLPVFPCRSDKAPACENGFKDAKIDRDAIAVLWRRSPGPLIGVPTGVASGVDVLDLDWPKGGEEWHAANHVRLPATRTHQTRSGGLHLLFRHQPGMRNSASKIAPGVDVRGDGGYVVWWPAAGLGVPAACPPAAWSAWLLEALAPPPRPVPAALAPVRTEERYVLGALRNAIHAVASAGEGARNQTLNNQTLSLSRFIRGGHLTEAEIARAMASAALEAGLGEREIEKTIASALRAGTR